MNRKVAIALIGRVEKILGSLKAGNPLMLVLFVLNRMRNAFVKWLLRLLMEHKRVSHVSPPDNRLRLLGHNGGVVIMREQRRF